MNRIKFLVFALIALGLWGYHLTAVAPAVTDHAQEAAMSSVAAVPHAVALRLESQRSDLQAAVVKVVGSGHLSLPAPKTPGKPEAPSAERLGQVRAVVQESLGDKKAQAVVGLSNEAGVVVAVGTGEPGPAPEGLDVASITQAQAAGAVATVGGAPHLFYAVPLLSVDKGEVKPAGFAFVGLPLLPDAKALVEGVAKDTKVSVGLSAAGALIASAGEKAALEKASKGKPGQISTTGEGPVDSFLGLSLPMFTQAPVTDVGVTADIAGTPYRVTAIASTRSSLTALAGYQKFGFSGLLGLLVLAIVFTVLIGGGAEEEGSRMVVPQMPVPPIKKEKAAEPEPTAAVPAPPAAVPSAPEAHTPEVSPDDFHFPSSPSSLQQPPSAVATGQAPAYAPPAPAPAPVFAPAPPPPAPAPAAPAFDPFGPPPSAATTAAAVPSPFAPSARQAPPPPEPPRAAAPAAMPFDEPDEEVRTSAYPAFKPPPATMAEARPSAPPPVQDPFAMAAAQLGEDDAQPHPDDADSTRVAAVPAALIQAAKTSSAPEQKAAPRVSAGAPSIPSLPRVGSVAPAVSEEERHFQDVFRDFVATREKCGEPADGLTFDKFKAKLLKNKEQLVAKYNCRSVRFQVYVKEGKAALKASPVKD